MKNTKHELPVNHTCHALKVLDTVNLTRDNMRGIPGSFIVIWCFPYLPPGGHQQGL